MKVAVVKYNAGNIRSVDYALKRLGVEAVITADKEELQSADKVIFPGVGEAETTMNHLKATGLDELIKNLRQPVFGICLGMQLMCRYSDKFLYWFYMPYDNSIYFIILQILQSNQSYMLFESNFLE